MAAPQLSLLVVGAAGPHKASIRSPQRHRQNPEFRVLGFLGFRVLGF